MEHSIQVEHYLGEMLGKMRHGFGVQTWPDGTKYEGEFKYNKAQGKGKYFHKNGEIYDGMNNQVNG